jgi:hypothetical protein
MKTSDYVRRRMLQLERELRKQHTPESRRQRLAQLEVEEGIWTKDSRRLRLSQLELEAGIGAPSNALLASNKKSYTRPEALRGDGGPELQQVVRRVVEYEKGRAMYPGYRRI